MTDVVEPQPAQIQPEQSEVAVAPKPKKTGVVILAVLVVLLLGAAGTFGALYFSEKNGHAAEKTRSAELSKQLDEKQKALTAQTMLSQSNHEELRKAQASASGAHQCQAAAREVTKVAVGGDQQKITAAVLAMMSQC